jgi:hypothetical protein
MIRLLYFSEAIPTVTKADIKEILVSARRRNKEMSVLREQD